MLRRRSLLPTLTELMAFESSARLGGFTRAAEELSLTQGAISRQIASLESTLGTSLFVRSRRTVKLTDAGRLYLNDVERILAQLSDSTERIAAFGADNVLNLAVLPTFATRWLMPRLPQFLAGAGQVTVNCAVRLEPFDFEREPFDAAIHFGEGSWRGGTAHYLCREDIVVVASPDLVQAVPLASPRDVLQATRLHQTTRPRAWQEWFAEQGLDEALVARGPRLEQFGMIAQAAIAGVGVALVPRFLILDDLAAGQLVEVLGPPVRSRQAYWLVIPNRKAEEPSVERFRLWIQRATGSGAN